MPISLAHTAPARLDWHGLPRLSATGVQPARAPRPPPAAQPTPWQDARFVALQGAYRANGGLERGEDLAVRLTRTGRGGYVELARAIVAGHLFSFHWNDHFWLPAFQFDPVTLSLREAPRRVMDELQGVYDGWDTATWYVRPHASLGGRRPLDLLSPELPSVLAAARADRAALAG